MIPFLRSAYAYGLALLLLTSAGCSSLGMPTPSFMKAKPVQSLDGIRQADLTPQPDVVPPAELVQAPVLLVPRSATALKEGSRIVIAEITGDCATHVKTALMRRLIENQRFNVLTRDHLEQIIWETDKGWGGRFNTETVAKLGKLMGASLWIVGDISYCGETFIPSRTSKKNPEFSVMATLQIINIDTGEVLVSSVSEGRYKPRTLASAELNRGMRERRNRQKAEEEAKQKAAKETSENQRKASDSHEGSGVAQAMQAASVASALVPNKSDRSRPWSRFTNFLGNLDDDEIEAVATLGDVLDDDETLQRHIEFIIHSAAEDMANGFADRFFARPFWENLELWQDWEMKYTEANRLIKLGDCPGAVRFLQQQPSFETEEMGPEETARYLHNYGVALICANEIQAAEEKLRAAYRITTDGATLSMMALANRISEWSLTVSHESQPEVHRLIAQEASSEEPLTPVEEGSSD